MSSPTLSSSPYHNNSTDELESDGAVRVGFALSCVILFFAILGSVANFISVIVYAHPAMRSSINVLLTGLSIIDLCLCICAIPTFVIPPMCVYFADAYWRENVEDKALCIIARYSTLYVFPLSAITQTCSIWTFVVITFERWIAVCRPFQARWASTGRSLRALAVVLILSVAYNLVRFYEHKHPQSGSTSASLTPSESNDSLSAAVRNQTLTTPNGIWNIAELYLKADEFYMTFYFSGLYLVTHFLIPFSVLAAVNGRMVYSIHQARQERRMLSHIEKKEHRTAVMMGLVVLMFVLTNSLTFVLNFVELIDKRLFNDTPTRTLMFALNDISNLLVLIHAATTAAFYYACSQKYRQLVHYYMARFWCTRCCISVIYPNLFVDILIEHQHQNPQLSSRLMSSSRMAFSFQSALSLYHPNHPGGAHEQGGGGPLFDGYHRSPSTTNSRRSSSAAMGANTTSSNCKNAQWATGGGSGGGGGGEERKCLIPSSNNNDSRYLNPNRAAGMNGDGLEHSLSSNHLSSSGENHHRPDRLTVPNPHQYVQIGMQRRSSQLSIRSLR